MKILKRILLCLSLNYTIRTIYIYYNQKTQERNKIPKGDNLSKIIGKNIPVVYKILKI